MDVLWTANPVVFGVGVLGAHLDLLATALALAAVLLAARRPWGAGLLLGAALSTKVTYGVVGVAILWSWRELDRRAALRRAGALVVGAAVVAVPLHLWAGPHVFEQLQRSRRSVSLATPWRPVVEVLTGPLPGATVRNRGRSLPPWSSSSRWRCCSPASPAPPPPPRPGRPCGRRSC